MALSAFDDKSTQPSENDLAHVLMESFVLWNKLKGQIASKFNPVSFEWGFTSKSTGWGLRVKHKTRTIVYMTPCLGYFLASFALGEKAVKAAHKSKLPTSVLQIIDGAIKYAEGRGVRLEVRNAKDVSNVEILIEIKLLN